MEVKNCKSCGRLYNYIGGSYKNLCHDCINLLEDKFIVVRQYIEEYSAANMSQISEDCDVKAEQIQRWVREERLFFSEDSPIGIDCESCGIMIKSGRFCPACKAKMTNVFSELYGSKSSAEPLKRKESERMRFLKDK